MLDVILGEYANAGKGVKSFHGAVEKLAKEEEPFVTSEQENVDVTVGADNLVEYVGGEEKYFQTVQEDVEGIVELMGNVIEESGAASADMEEYFLPAMDNGACGLHGPVLARGPVLPLRGEQEPVTILRPLGEEFVLEGKRQKPQLLRYLDVG